MTDCKIRETAHNCDPKDRNYDHYCTAHSEPVPRLRNGKSAKQCLTGRDEQASIRRKALAVKHGAFQ